jgi:hypothetical protein
MKIKHITKSLFTAALAVSCIWLSGCASTPSEQQAGQAQSVQPTSGGMTKEQILSHPDVKGHPPVVFAKNLEEVRQAGLRSLTFVGCKLKTQQPLFLSGDRPHKFGLFVGSGGETVNVFLYPESDTETHVWVETHKSFVGMVGQQGWNKQVIDQMTQLLTSTASNK